MAGETDKGKGRMKEAVGDFKGDKSMKNEGKVDRAAGSIKDKVGDVVDKVRGKATK